MAMESPLLPDNPGSRRAAEWASTSNGLFGSFDSGELPSGQPDDNPYATHRPGITEGNSLIVPSSKSSLDAQPEAYRPEMDTLGDSIHTPLPPIEQLPESQLLIGEGVQATPDAVADVAAEAKRTQLSDDCLREAYGGTQNKLSGLAPQDFAELQAFTRRSIGDETTFDSVRYYMDIHDVGKSDRVRNTMGVGEHVDHDEVFTMLVCDEQYADARRELLPTFDTLPVTGQDLIRRASQAQLNYPQTLQGEAPAATLQGISAETDQQVRDVDILKSIFDIAGAAGHINADRSVTMTSSTWRRMKNLNTALQDPGLTTATERNNAFLDAETRDLGGTTEVNNQAALDQVRAVARLGCHLRIGSPEAFAQLKDTFERQQEPVRAILTAELNRTGIDDRATLPYYGPKLLQEMTKKYGAEQGLTFYAHILQEAHIADRAARAAGQNGVVLAELGGIVKDVISGNFDPREAQIRFTEQEGVLVPHTVTPELTDLSLPLFENSGAFEGKRAILIGMGGGSDGVQVADLRKILKDKYGLEDAVVVSVRNEKHTISQPGEAIGTATHEVTAATKPIGGWRYLENIPLEGSDPARTYLLSSTDPAVIQGDINALVAVTGAQVVIGLDTGGDSLYRTEHAGYSAASPTDTTPDQDHQVLSGLAALAAQNPQLRVFSTVVAPGVDSPPYAQEVLDAAGATQIPLTGDDVQHIKGQYAEWRMDGSGNAEGRYGKTPLAWLHALDGNMGVQVLNLPAGNAVSNTNPWRTFATITPSMAAAVIMDATKHYEATQYQPKETTQ